jgi:LysM repeat protein
MPVDLYVGPRRKRPGRVLLLALAMLVLAWLWAWQQGWQPNRALAKLGQDVLHRAPAPIAQLQTQLTRPKTDAVVMVNSTVVERPESLAYTAALYSPTAADGVVPWPNIAGRTQVQTYVVQEGDTLWSIAVQFELDLDSLRWSNPALERNPDLLGVGAELIILPVQGVYHIVTAEDTLESIAAQYGVAATDISDYPPNGLYPPYKLKTGRGLIVPFGRKGGVLPPPNGAVASVLAWPVVGMVTGGFEADHQALDIGAPYGSTVYAAAPGSVRYAGWGDDGLGFTIVVDHGEGLETLYLHLKGALVQAGADIARGDAIGEVGSTGHSNGPHLHFEVRQYGQLVSPVEYLPSVEPQ